MNLYFREQGKGTPIIFLHGFPFDHTLWEPIRKLLPEDFHSIFPDIRGFGKSLVNKPDYLMEDLAKDIIHLMNAEGLSSSIIAGHSMGGYLALEVLRQTPNRVGGVILVASHIYADTKEKQADRYNTISQLETKTPAQVLIGMPKKLSADKNVQSYCQMMVEKSNTIGVQGALGAMAKRQSSETLWAKSAIPKLVIAGEKDQFIKKEVVNKMAAAGRNVSVKMIKDAGHMVMRERPTYTAEMIKDFVRQV